MVTSGALAEQSGALRSKADGLCELYVEQRASELFAHLHTFLEKFVCAYARAEKRAAAEAAELAIASAVGKGIDLNIGRLAVDSSGPLLGPLDVHRRVMATALGGLAYTGALCTQISQFYSFFLVHLLEIYTCSSNTQ